MAFGLKVAPGGLPVFSVGTEAEAHELLVAACPTTLKGEFYAPELADSQTLENLERFSDRLDVVHEQMRAVGRCRCTGGEAHT